MNKYPLIGKCLAVGIILLFIGVAVAPSINSSVVKTSDDLVEVTSQACGIQGFGNTTVKLTKQQYQNLEQYLVDFQIRINKTANMEETIPLFNEAVVELNKYGLLPKGLNVEKAQKLVIGQIQNNIMTNLREKIFHSQVMTIDNMSNYNCLVEGRGDGVNFGSTFWDRVFSVIESHPLLFSILIIPFFILALILMFFPLSILAWIGLGIVVDEFSESNLNHMKTSNRVSYAFHGDLFTRGRNFSTSWPNATLHGNITYYSHSGLGTSSTIWIGVAGFSGIKIVSVGPAYFFGYTQQVKIHFGYPPLYP